MARREDLLTWIPEWIHALGVATWITDPDGNISYLNERAASLLGRTVAESVGLPCYRVIGGHDVSDRPHCRRECPLYLAARNQNEIQPTSLHVTRPNGEGRWVQVLPISLKAPDGTAPWLVHCALSADRAHRVEDYLGRLASRTHDRSVEAGPERRWDRRSVTHPPPPTVLTQREEEILQLLVEDHDLQSIASELHVSYATVRNHVQHMLAKLGVHSIAEAVAYHLVMRD